jgi:hypothetical protein
VTQALGRLPSSAGLRAKRAAFALRPLTRRYVMRAFQRLVVSKSPWLRMAVVTDGLGRVLRNDEDAHELGRPGLWLGLLEGVLDFFTGLLELGLSLIFLALSFEFVGAGRPTRGFFALALKFFDLVLGLVRKTHAILPVRYLQAVVPSRLRIGVPGR